MFPHGDEIPWCTWPQNLFHSDGYRLDSHSVKKYVAPDPSDRTTGVIGRFGNWAP